jgi:hypothetical protein
MMIRSEDTSQLLCSIVVHLENVRLTNESNRHSWNTSVWVEGPQVELRETNSRVHCLRHGLNVRQSSRVAGILQHHLCPHFANLALRLRLELTNYGQHEVVPVRVVSRVLVHQLTCAKGIVARVSCSDSLIQQGRRVRVDDDSSPGIPIIYRLSHCYGVVVELISRSNAPAECWHAAVQLLLDKLGNCSSYERLVSSVVVGRGAIHINHIDKQMVQAILDLEEYTPVY